MAVNLYQEATSLAVQQTTRWKGQKNQPPAAAAAAASTLLEVRSFFHPLLDSNRIEKHKAADFPRFPLDSCWIELGFLVVSCLKNACEGYFVGRPENHRKQEQEPAQKPATKQSTPGFLAKWYFESPFSN
jgi:hypothetical protein